jgi:L-threonylcarbamoyladenylate synthase
MRIDIDMTARYLRQGQVIAYPTEAVWGLGCDPYQHAAFDKILALKQRPIEKGVILIAASVTQVEPFLAGLDETQRQMVLSSWPAALTWLVPLTPAVPTWIRGQHDRVAVRVSSHPIVQAICTAFGGVIVSTSANPAGLDSARSANEVMQYFGQAVPCTVGEVGDATRPSTIKDAVTGAILRP